MATFYLGSVNSDLSSSALFNKNLISATTTADTLTMTCTTKRIWYTGSAYSVADYFNNGDWETGGITVKINVTTANSNITMKVNAHRINAAGTIQESCTETGTQTISSTGLYTFNIGSKDWAAGNATDRLRIDYMAYDSKGGNSIIMSTNVANTEVATSIEVQVSPTTTLGNPADTATGQSTTPELFFTGTDANGDAVEYHVQVDTVNTFDSDTTVVDSVTSDSSYQRVVLQMTEGYKRRAGQTITANGELISSVDFYIYKTGSPTGNGYAKIYEITGTYGTDAEPTGSALASSVFDISTIPSSIGWFTITFATPFQTESSHYYAVELDLDGSSIDADNYVRVYGVDELIHDGNGFTYGTSYSSSSTYDVSISVNSDTPLLDKLSETPDTGFTAGHPFASAAEKSFTVQGYTAVDIGAEAIDRGASVAASLTNIGLDNPANANSTITQLELWANTSLTNCKVGTFYGSGTDYQCRDFETIGTVTSGSKQTFSVNITVQTGDFLGVYYTAGQLEIDTSGGAGRYFLSGDHFSDGVQTYILGANQAISLKGYTVDDTLDASTLYYWRARAKDPSGTDTYGAWATTKSFTTGGGSTTITAELADINISTFDADLKIATHLFAELANVSLSTFDAELSMPTVVADLAEVTVETFDVNVGWQDFDYMIQSYNKNTVFGTTSAGGGNKAAILDNTSFANLYKDSSNNIILCTYSVDANQNITEEDRQTVRASSGGSVVRIITIDSTHVFVAYSYSTTVEFKTYSIDGNKDLTLEDTHVLTTSVPSIYIDYGLRLLDSTHAVVNFYNSSYVLYTQIININGSTYEITEGDSELIYTDGGSCRTNDIAILNSTHFAVAYSDTGEKPYIKTFSVDGSYIITNEDTYQVDSVNNQIQLCLESPNENQLILYSSWVADRDIYNYSIHVNTSDYSMSAGVTYGVTGAVTAWDGSLTNIDSEHYLVVPRASIAPKAVAYVVKIQLSGTLRTVYQQILLKNDNVYCLDVKKLGSTDDYILTYSTYNAGLGQRIEIFHVGTPIDINIYAELANVEVETFDVNLYLPDPNYALTLEDNIEHDTSYGYSNALLTINDTHLFLAYKGATEGTAKTFTLDGNYDITQSDVDNYSTTTNVNYNAVCWLDSTHFVIAYNDLGTTSGIVRIYAVDGSYVLTNLKSLTHESGGSTLYHSITAIDSTHFVLTYLNASYDYMIKTFSIDGSYNITQEDSLLVDTAVHSTVDITKMDSTHVMVISSKNGINGISVKTFTIDGSFDISVTDTEPIGDGGYGVTSITQLSATQYICSYFSSPSTGIYNKHLVLITTDVSYFITATDIWNSTVSGWNVIYQSLSTIDGTHFAFANSVGDAPIVLMFKVDNDKIHQINEISLSALGNTSSNSLVTVDGTHLALAFGNTLYGGLATLSFSGTPSETRIIAELSDINISTFDATLAIPLTIEADMVNISLSSFNIEFAKSVKIQAELANVQATTFDVEVEQSVNINAELAQINISSFDAEYLQSILIAVDLALIGVSTFDAEVEQSILITTDLSNVNMSTFDADFAQSILIDSELSNINVSTFDADIQQSIKIEAELADINVSTFDATLALSILVIAELANIQISTFDATFSESALVESEMASVNVTTFDAEYAQSILVSTDLSNVSVSTFDIEFAKSVLIDSEMATVNVSTFDITKQNILSAEMADVELSTFDIITQNILHAEMANISVSTFDANRVASVLVEAELANINISTFDAEYAMSVLIDTDLSNINVNTFDAEYAMSVLVEANLVNINVSTFDANIVSSVAIEAELANINVSTFDMTKQNILHTELASVEVSTFDTINQNVLHAEMANVEASTFDANVSQSVKIESEMADVNVSTFIANVGVGINIEAEMANINVTTFDADFSSSVLIQSELSNINVSTFDAEHAHSILFEAEMASINVSTFDIEFAQSVFIEAGMADINVSTFDAELSTSVTIITDLAIIQVSTFDAVFAKEIEIVAELADVNVSTFDANIKMSIRIDAELADVNVSTFDTEFAHSVLVVNELSNVQVSTFEIEFAESVLIDAEMANVNVSTFDVTTKEIIAIELANVNVSTFDVAVQNIITTELAGVEVNTFDADLAHSILIIAELSNVEVSTLVAEIARSVSIEAEMVNANVSTFNANVEQSIKILSELSNVEVSTFDATAREIFHIELAEVEVSTFDVEFAKSIKTESELVNVEVSTFDASLNTSISIVAELANISVSTFDATITKEIEIIAELAEINVSTFDIEVAKSVLIDTDLANVQLSTFDAELAFSVRVISELTNIQVSTFDAEIEQSILIEVDMINVQVSTFDANIEQSVLVEAELSDINVSTFDVTTLHIIEAELTVINVGSFDANLAFGVLIQTDLSEINVSTFDANIGGSIDIEAELAIINVSTFDAVVAQDRKIEAELANIEVSTFDIEIKFSISITSELANVNVSTFDVEVRESIRIDSELANINITTFDAIIAKEINIEAELANIEVSTFDANVGQGIVKAIELANVNVSTFDADIEFSIKIDTDLSNVSVETFDAETATSVLIVTELANISVATFGANIGQGIVIATELANIQVPTFDINIEFSIKIEAELVNVNVTTFDVLVGQLIRIEAELANIDVQTFDATIAFSRLFFAELANVYVSTFDAIVKEVTGEIYDVRTTIERNNVTGEIETKNIDKRTLTKKVRRTIRWGD